METLHSFSKEELIALILQQRGIVEEQAEALKHAQKEIANLKEILARLRNGGEDKKPPTPPPDWVKANTKPANTEDADTKRKKRAQNFTWKRREPTKTVEHACDTCPDCGRGLSGGWEYSRRQIIEIPPIEVQIVDHVVMARHCGVCGKDCVPTVDYAEETVGGCHYGHHLLSLVAYLRSVCRLPMQSIQQMLEALMGLHLSLGEISQLLHRVANAGGKAYEEMGEEVRKSDCVNADETGWRENGQNGYVWSFSTEAVRYFVHDKSRSHHVPESVLGKDFRGVLVSDFYSGYHYYLGPHQRCWVHLLRDVHELKQKYPTPGVLAWAQKLRDIYDRAKAFSSECPRARCAARLEFQAQILELAYPYEKAGLPQSVLASRLITFEAELFTFVEYPFVPSENNAAERSVRPRVIARKISGGTRSSTGSTTMAVLSSLFETWRLQGANCLEACRKMLIASQQPKAAPAS